jgi:uncharacterized protein
MHQILKNRVPRALFFLGGVCIRHDEALCAKGVDQPIKQEEVALSLADMAATGDSNGVRVNLAGGALINESQLGSHITALHNACAQGKTDIVRFLISKDAKVDSTDSDGATPLIYAAYAGETEIVATLIQAGAKVNHVPKLGLTAIAAAVVSDSRPTMQLLMDHGADASLSAPNSFSALSLAELRGQHQLITLLIRKE